MSFLESLIHTASVIERFGETTLTRRDFNKAAVATTAAITVGGVFAAGCTPGASEIISFGKTPEPLKTPTIADLKPAIWIKVFERLGSTLTNNLHALEAITDPLLRNRVAEALIQNAINSGKNGALTIEKLLREAGKVLGVTLCGDSRVICNSTYYVGEQGTIIEGFATVEQRSLGAAPRVYSNNVDESVVAVHSNICKEQKGCGAIDALAKANEPGGIVSLKAHNIDPSTIHEVVNSLESANPDDQAIIAARFQARVNGAIHGKRHITAAVRMGNADGEMRLLAVFDETGRALKEDEIPEMIKAFVTINNKPVAQIDEVLARTQTPPEGVINSTVHKIQDLLGIKAAQPGHTFKITAMPQDGVSTAINVADAKQGLAGMNYFLSHNWGRLQWIIANSKEELVLLREQALASEKMWQFLGRNGVIVEVVADVNGVFVGSLKITELASIPDDVKNIMMLKKTGFVTREVTLSAKTLAEAQQLFERAKKAGDVKEASKWQFIADKLKEFGKYGSWVMKILGPVLNAGAIIGAVDVLQARLGLSFTDEDHNLRFNSVGSMDNATYDRLFSLKPRVEPLLQKAKNFTTTYTKEQLGISFLGLIKLFTQSLTDPVFGKGSLTYGPKNPNSPFFGYGLSDMAKVLRFGFTDNIDQRTYKKLEGVNSPIIFFALPIVEPGTFGEAKIDYSDTGILKSPMMIKDTETGQFVITGYDMEMIVKVRSVNPEKGREKTVYYFHLRTDRDGNLHVTNVGYDDSGEAFSKAPFIIPSAIKGARNANLRPLLRNIASSNDQLVAQAAKDALKKINTKALPAGITMQLSAYSAPEFVLENDEASIE